LIEVDDQDRLWANGLEVTDIELRVSGRIRLSMGDRAHAAFVRSVTLGDRRALAVDAFVNRKTVRHLRDDKTGAESANYSIVAALDAVDVA
jgi:hypothetical protein